MGAIRNEWTSDMSESARLHCPTCGEVLVPAETDGYHTCPVGHGRLVKLTADEARAAHKARRPAERLAEARRKHSSLPEARRLELQVLAPSYSWQTWRRAYSIDGREGLWVEDGGTRSARALLVSGIQHRAVRLVLAPRGAKTRARA